THSVSNTPSPAAVSASNNRFAGKLAETRDGRARIEGAGWSLWGMLRGEPGAGSDAHGVIRLEQVRVAADPGDNRLKLALSSSMSRGDRWEHLFRMGDLPLRAYGNEELSAGEYWVEFPAE